MIQFFIGFGKPVVTSNGVSPSNKLIRGPAYPHLAGEACCLFEVGVTRSLFVGLCQVLGIRSFYESMHS